MQWTTLPPVDWSLLILGVFWSLSWVIVISVTVWAAAYLTGWSRVSGTGPVGLDEQR